MTRIVEIVAREILDSQGHPTVEAEVELECGARGKAVAPSGASVGKHQAAYLYDGEEDRYAGKGVLKAVKNVHQIIGPKLKGMDALAQRLIDSTMCDLDGTPNKEKLGGNAILAASLAVARAAAEALGLPLYRYLGGVNAHVLPAPMMNVMAGRADMREVMIVPVAASSFREALRAGAEVMHCLERLLEEKASSASAAGDDGPAPSVQPNEQAIQTVLEAIEKAQYKPGEDICLALSMDGTKLCQDGTYVLNAEESPEKDVDAMLEFYVNLVEKYPIRSIEDPFASDDWDAWKKLTAKIGDRAQIVGGDLYASNADRLSRGIRNQSSNSALVRLSQIGTLSQTLETIETAQNQGMAAVVCSCSGETEDTTISDIAVATNAGRIKTGSPCRIDGICKYNQLLRIEEELGDSAVYGATLWNKQ